MNFEKVVFARNTFAKKTKYYALQVQLLSSGLKNAAELKVRVLFVTLVNSFYRLRYYLVSLDVREDWDNNVRQKLWPHKL